MRAVSGLVAAFSLVAAGHPALAQKRVALIIDNSTYQNVPRLDNPANDAMAMTGTMQKQASTLSKPAAI